MNRLMHMMINVMNSTIAEPFKAGVLCFKVLNPVAQFFNLVGCLKNIART